MNVGDYVRTENGDICKIVEFGFNSRDIITFLVTDKSYNSIIYFDQKFKTSSNIIDLIEVGDYVNGYRVDFTNISEKLSYEDKCIGFYDGDGDINLFEEDIETIVTHEQMETMQYRVEE